MSAPEGGQQLTTLVQSIIQESKQLRRDVQAYEEAHQRERRAYRVIGAVLLAAILACLILVSTARQSLHNTQETVELVRSCTTPEGECYQRNRAGTVDFREQLLGAIAVITDCDVSHDELARFRACVSKRTALDASKSIATNPNN